MNGTMMQYFEWHLPSGMLWNRLAKEAKTLCSDGITAVWIPPCYKASDGIFGTGYAPYDLYDLGEFDQKGTIPTKYGTRQQLLDAIEEVHGNGMQVYADVVLDHKMGADGLEHVLAYEVNPENRYENEGKEREIGAWTHFTFPGRAKKYSDFEWHWTHFIGIDWDEEKKEHGIFRFKGKHWSPLVDREFGNFDYLMGADIDLNNEEVKQELIRWGMWLVDTLNIDGFRMDAVKHMRFTFYNEWLAALREKTGKELFSVGEYWHGDYRALRHYIDTTKGALSLFDVALHFRFYDAATQCETFDMRGIFGQTLTQDNPMRSVTFVDNHDTQPGESLVSWVPAWFKPIAYALILLRQEGFPCVFYGDYYGIEHSGIPSIKEKIRPLMLARRFLAYGRQIEYFDHPDAIGWTRTGDANHQYSGLAALVSNGAGSTKRMYVGEHMAGTECFDCTGNIGEVVPVGQDGYGVFSVREKSCSVWVSTKAKQYFE